MYSIRTHLYIVFLLFVYTGVAEAQSPTAPLNLGSSVNSATAEIMPVVSADGSTLYFTRQDHPQNMGSLKQQDIWYATSDAKGDWSMATNVGTPLNTHLNNYLCSVTPDGNSVLIGDYYKANGVYARGFFLSHRQAQGWSPPQKLHIRSYQNKNRFSGAYLAPDGKTLILSIETDDSYGNLDLYISRLRSDGSWSKPLNLGETINSTENDATPFLAADGRSLYFSSDGFGGEGDMDIFVSRRLDESWTSWSTPVNLGKGINTAGFDSYFSITAEGSDAYMVSTESGLGEEDIFRVEVPPTLRPEPVVIIKGKVINQKDNKPVAAGIRYEQLNDGTELGLARSVEGDGKFQIVLPAGKSYGFHAFARGYFPINENLDLSTLTDYKIVEINLKLVPIESGQTLPMQNIFFETGKYNLQPASNAELKRVADILRENPKLRIEIVGHTDDVGTSSSNMLLSQQRAVAVKSYIVSLYTGADAQISTKGLGDTKPVSDNSTDEGRMQNRRVELHILAN